jgi:hypothetical protein
MWHRQILEADKLLKGHKSFIKAIMHDAVYFDIAVSEKHMLKTVVDTLRSTPYGYFKMSVKAGGNMGELKEVSI